MSERSELTPYIYTIQSPISELNLVRSLIINRYTNVGDQVIELTALKQSLTLTSKNYIIALGYNYNAVRSAFT